MQGQSLANMLFKMAALVGSSKMTQEQERWDVACRNNWEERCSPEAVSNSIAKGDGFEMGHQALSGFELGAL